MKRELTSKRGRGFFFEKDRRGLSEIVATLIIILLVIIAIGIVWGVVRNLIQGGADQIELSTKCNNLDVSAKSVSEAYDGGENSDYTVRLSRGADSEEALEGIRITFYNSTDNSDSLEFGESLSTLDEKTRVIGDVPVQNATRIAYTAYFHDDSGNVQLCPGWTRTFKF